jgi:hypothetical protein
MIALKLLGSLFAAAHQLMQMRAHPDAAESPARRAVRHLVPVFIVAALVTSGVVVVLDDSVRAARRREDQAKLALYEDRYVRDSATYAERFHTVDSKLDALEGRFPLLRHDSDFQRLRATVKEASTDVHVTSKTEVFKNPRP